MGRTKSNSGYCAACGMQLTGTRASIIKHLDVCDQTAARLAGTDTNVKASVNAGTKVRAKNDTKAGTKTGTTIDTTIDTTINTTINKKMVKLFCGKEIQFFRVHVRSNGGQYWLVLDVKADVTLHDLDAYLRDIWLECCDHLSCFTIEGIRYQSDDEMAENSWDGLDTSMSAKLSEVFTVGTLAEYVYDFGSSTYLLLIVDSMRGGTPRMNPVLMLSRNAPIEQVCEACGNAAATLFCPQCRWDEGNGLFCSACHEARECGEGASVSNSPRTGVCAYEGPAEWFNDGAVSPVTTDAAKAKRAQA